MNASNPTTAQRRKSAIYCGRDAFLGDFDSICREANGNHTLCHRITGDVLVFAPDPAFTHIEVLAGCPPHSLHRIPEAPTFVRWVEAISERWSAACGLA